MNDLATSKSAPSAGADTNGAAVVVTSDAVAREAQIIVDGFTRAWATPQLERFIELLHPDVRLLQPVTRPIIGRAAARAEFARLLRWLPDMRGTVDESAIHGNVALIAWRLAFGLG